MPSFLPVIVSKKNKQTEINMSFIAVYHKFHKSWKKHEKPHHNDCLNVPTYEEVLEDIIRTVSKKGLA